MGALGHDEDSKTNHEEGKDIDHEEGEGEGDVDLILNEKKTAKRILKIQNYLYRFLSRLLVYLDKRLMEYDNAASPFHIKLQPFTLKDFSNFMIALQVAIHFGGRVYDYEEEGKNAKYYFMHVSGSLDVVDNLKAFGVYIIGSFLLLLTSGTESYNDESVKVKN